MPEHVHRGPRELVDRALDLLLAHDMAGFADLFAVDGVAEFPFAPSGYPQRLDGRPALTEYLRDYTNYFDVRAVTGKTVHQTVDPEIVVLEFEVDGIAVQTNRPYRMCYICVITARRGEIVRYRDYWNPLGAADAVGGADRLTDFGTSGRQS
jgi:uncharacterized protein